MLWASLRARRVKDWCLLLRDLGKMSHLRTDGSGLSGTEVHLVRSEGHADEVWENEVDYPRFGL